MHLLVLDTQDLKLHVKQFRQGDIALSEATQTTGELLHFHPDFYRLLNTKSVEAASIGSVDKRELLHTGFVFMVSDAVSRKELAADIRRVQTVMVDHYTQLKLQALNGLDAEIARMNSIQPGVIDVELQKTQA